MDWIQVKISAASEDLDTVCGALYNMGITEIEISDKNDFREFLENNRRYWDYVDEELEKLKTADSCITLYATDDAEGKAQVKAVKAAMSETGIGGVEVYTKPVKDEDWSENWKQYFKPLEIGKRVLVVPEWEKDIPQTERTKVIINPGMSFGTGSHESTRMCIEEIENSIKPDATVLDLGCGSGILSVIALLLGAKSATAVDIDPMAVETAYSNLALNNLPKEIYCGYAGDITRDAVLCKKLSQYKSDIVLANIVADVIINLSGYVRDFMAEDGVFICSGIIIERKDEVKKALRDAGLKIIKERVMGEWAAFVAQ